MILDCLPQWRRYATTLSGLAKAFEYLQTLDAGCPNGRYELDGDKVFALVQSYQSKPRAEGKWEAHCKYIDVQYIASGAERIGWTHVSRLTLTEPYDETKDIAFYKGTGDFVTVPAGSFAILFPEDAHMPGIAVDTPSPVTKVVVKVRV